MNQSPSAPTSTKYYLFVDPSVLRLNRDMHQDEPTIVVRDEEHNQLAVAHEVRLFEGSVLKQFADGERNSMGQHVCVVVEPPLQYRVGPEWKVLE